MTSIYPKGLQGLSDSKHQGKTGTAHRVVGVDYRSVPGIMKVHQKLTKNSGSTVTELCKARIPVSDGSTLWFSSESGKIWREIAGVWSLVYTLALGLFDILTAIYSEKFIDVSAKTTQPIAVLGNSGAKMFVLEYTSNEIHDYDLSTAYDVSTAVFDSTFSINSQVTSARSFFVRANGTKYFVCSASAVFAYTLTAWDVSTSVYATETFSFAAQTSNCQGIWFKDDGTKMYVAGGQTPGTVYQYTLGTPWDVSTASYDTVSFTFSGGTTAGNAFAFNEDGSKLYFASTGTIRGIMQYTVATPWSLASVTYDNKNLLLRSTTTGAGGHLILHIFFRSNGENMYLSQANLGLVRQYNLSIITEEIKTLDATEHRSLEIDNGGITAEDDSPTVQYIYWAIKNYIYRIPTSSIASWGDDVQVVGKFENGNDTYHPMEKQNLNLFIGDGKDMASIDEFGGFTAQSLFNLPETETITALSPFDIDLLIGTKWIGMNKARVLRWDTTSESWSAEDQLNESVVNAFIQDDNYVYANVGEYGRIYYYNGEKMEPFKRIPGDWSPTKKGIVYPNAVGFHLGIPVFGLSNVTGDPALQGVYGLGSFSRDYSKTLSLDFPLSTGNFGGVTIGAILVRDFDLYVAWKDASGSGVDKLDWSAKYASAYIETTMLVGKEMSRSAFKTLARTYLPFASLPDDTDVEISYKKKHEVSFSSLTTKRDDKLMQIRSEKTVPEIANLQLRFDFTVNDNDSPEIEDVCIDWVTDKKTI